MSTLMLYRFSFKSLYPEAVLCVGKLVSILVVLLLTCFSLPLSSVASTDIQIQKVVKSLDTQDYQEAIELLHDLQGSLANPAQLDNLLAVAYMGRGYQLLASADLTASGEAFQEGRRYNDEDIRLWRGEAMVRFKQGRYSEAVSLLDQAIGVNSQNASLYHLLGQAYYADGRMPEAVDALTVAISLGGDDAINKFLQKVQREWQIEQEMEQESRGHFQLSFVDGKQVAELAPRILETLEDAYTELGSELAYFPDIKVPVLIYLRKDFSAVTNSPDWAGGVYDGKIRLPLGGMHQMTDQLAAVLYHEYMHVLVHFMTGRRAPVWLNEGLAEMAGRRLSSPPTHHLYQALQRADVLGWEALAKPFSTLPSDKVLLAYEQSYSLVNFMVDRYGWHKISELLESIGKQKPWQLAIADVYLDYGLDWPAILKEWQASLSL
jgi:tetratricopeptide (TPR) repeat protein